MARTLFTTALVLWACSCKSEEEAHLAHVDESLASLDVALAAGDEVRVTTGCAGLEPSWEKIQVAAVQRRIERGCYVEAPRLILKNAIAKVVENNRKHPDPDMKWINCAELFVGGALQTLAKHPTTDPELQKLADEYTRLCPAEAAKARGSGG